jgi:hypothetical protein
MTNARDKANIPVLNFQSKGIDDNATSTAITIDSSERVGINNASPTGALDVKSSTQPQLKIATASATADRNAGFLVTASNSATAGSRSVVLSLDADGGDGSGTDNLTITKTGGNGDATITNESNANIVFGTNNAEKVRITSAGQLLVGTTDAPSSADTPLKVHVPITSSGRNAIEISQNTTGTDKPGAALGLIVDNSGSSTNAAQLSFSTASGGSLSEKMRITSAGRIGINDSSPDCILNIGTNSGISNGERIRIEDGTYKLDIGVGATSFIQTIGASTLKFNTNSTEAMRIHTNQRISMGTTSSGANLELASTKRTTGQGLESGGICLRNTGTVAGGNVLPITARLVNGANARAGIGFVAQTQDGGNAGYAGEIAFYTMGSADGAALTNSFERVRINKSGNFGIGTSTPSQRLHVYSTGTTARFQRQQGDNNLRTHIEFIREGNTVGEIQCSNTSTTYATSSDYRLKENVVEIEDATTRLKQLKPKRFNFIANTDITIDGFLAHEVSSVVPEAITGEKDAIETYTDDDGNEQTRPVYQGIDQSKLVPLLVKTIQELEARITTLEANNP